LNAGAFRSAGNEGRAILLKAKKWSLNDLTHRRARGSENRSSRERGRDWERVAESMLRRRGLRTLTRNYLCRSGEIDLVMLDGPVLVFIEVRYRHSNRYGSGADSVTPAKQRRIVSAARQFLGRHPDHGQRPSRFDVVSIGQGAGGAEISWIRAAFDSG